MPYIPQGLRAELKTEPQRAKDNVGAMNYLFSEAILKVWNATPKYETIHRLKIATDYTPNDFDTIGAVDVTLFELGVSDEDRKAARQLAFVEFYRRIGAQYEFSKLNKNGDLEGYTEALLYLNNLAREDFNSRIKYEEKK